MKNTDKLPYFTREQCLALVEGHYIRGYQFPFEFAEKIYELRHISKSLLYEMGEIYPNWDNLGKILPKLFQEFSKTMEEEIKNLEEIFIKIEEAEKFQFYKFQSENEIGRAKAKFFFIKYLIQLFRRKFTRHNKELSDHYSVNGLTGEIRFFRGRLASNFKTLVEFLDPVLTHYAQQKFIRILEDFVISNFKGIRVISKIEILEQINQYLKMCKENTSKYSSKKYNIFQTLKSEDISSFFKPSSCYDKSNREELGANYVALLSLSESQSIRFYLLTCPNEDDFYFLLHDDEHDVKEALGESYPKLEDYLQKMIENEIDITKYWHNSTNLGKIYRGLKEGQEITQNNQPVSIEDES